MLSRRTKEASLDTLEKCSLLSLVVAHEARLVDWCCCATFFLHVQQGGFAHTLIMVSNSPNADALRSNVCVSTCWRDYWTRFLKIVVGGRRGACRRYVICFSHCSRRRCVRHRDMQVTRGATTPSTSITHSASRCAGMCVGRAP